MSEQKRAILNMVRYGFYTRDVRRLREFIQKPVVDVTITSPPYYDLKDYGSPRQIGYGQTYEQYLDDLREVFKSIYEITKDTGSLWIIADSFKWRHAGGPYRRGELVLLPYDLAQRLRAVGWTLTDIMIWHKDKTLPWSHKGQLRKTCELILFFTKTSRYKFYVDRIRVATPEDLKEWWLKYPERYNPLGAAPTNVWFYPIPVQGSWGHRVLRHFNPLPLKMIQRIILATTNRRDVVLDPFAGSGVVVAVAEYLKRRGIGFEVNVEYVKRYRQVVKKEAWTEMDKYASESLRLVPGRRRFNALVRQLRLVKYPKVLVRRLEEGGLDKQLRPTAVFAVKREFEAKDRTGLDRHKLLAEELYLVFRNTINKPYILQKLAGVCSRPPLSKFGILPTFHVFNQTDFTRACPFPPNAEFWLYVNGATYKAERKVAFSDWLQSNLSSDSESNRTPSLLCSIRVDPNPIVKYYKSRQPESLSTALIPSHLSHDPVI